MEHLLGLVDSNHIMALIICGAILSGIVFIKRSIEKAEDGTYAEKKAMAGLRVKKAEALANRELESLPQIVHTGIAEKE